MPPGAAAFALTGYINDRLSRPSTVWLHGHTVAALVGSAPAARFPPILFSSHRRARRCSCVWQLRTMAHDHQGARCIAYCTAVRACSPDSPSSSAPRNGGAGGAAKRSISARARPIAMPAVAPLQLRETEIRAEGPRTCSCSMASPTQAAALRAGFRAVSSG